jgi:c-di-GMP-binding flagellar brake protein YcgR
MLDEDKLALQVGDDLQLQYVDGEHKNRHHVKVIGYLVGKSIVVTSPHNRGKVALLREGQPFVVRLLSGNRVMGFNTTVLRSSARPYPYLHLEYPDHIEQTVVRKAQRVRVKLVSFVTNDKPDFHAEKPIPAVISDLSTSGAMLVSSQYLGEIGDVVSLAIQFTVAGVNQSLKIHAFVRNVREDDDVPEGGECHFYHGLEFQPLAQTELLALHGYVYEQLLDNQGS